MRLLGFALGLAVLAAGGLRADDRKAEDAKAAKVAGPAGKFEKPGDPFVVAFDFKKDGVCFFSMKNGAGDSCTVETKYNAEKEKLSFEVVKFETKGNFPVHKDKGYKFSFEYALKDKTMTVKKFDAADVDDGGKGLIEGEYGPPKGD